MRPDMVLPLIAALLAAVSASAQDYTFKLHHFLGPTTPTQTETIEPWARAVEAASGGRLAIEIYPSMSLGGKPAELVQQARDGVVDMVWTVNGYTPGLFPHGGVRASERLHQRSGRHKPGDGRGVRRGSGVGIWRARGDVPACPCGQRHPHGRPRRPGAGRSRGRETEDPVAHGGLGDRGAWCCAGRDAGAGSAAGALERRGRRRVDPVRDHTAAQAAGSDQNSISRAPTGTGSARRCFSSR